MWKHFCWRAHSRLISMFQTDGWACLIKLFTAVTKGNPNRGGRLSTVYLIIKVTRFVKK